MNIRPSTAIRQNYNEIADLCRKIAEPVFLTKNGEGDLVVMDIETYNRREKILGNHIYFMVQVNKEAAAAKKKEVMTAMRSLSRMPERVPFFEAMYITRNKYHKMFVEKWYLIHIRFRMK